MPRFALVPRASRGVVPSACRAGGLAVALGLGGLLAQQQTTLPPANGSPLRLVGTFDGPLEHVAMRPDGTAMLTARVAATGQAFARGDDVQVFAAATGRTIATGSVAADARVAPGTDHLHVAVAFADPTAVARLVRPHGSKVTIRTMYRAERGDRLADFVRIDATTRPGPVEDPARVPPECAFTLRFDRPVDPATLDRVALHLRGAAGADAVVPMRVLAADDAGSAFRFEPPLGLAFTPAMQRAARERPEEPHYVLRVADGPDGVRGRGGESLATPLALPITIDAESPIRLVGWRTFR